jgi:hypothetical protein
LISLEVVYRLGFKTGEFMATSVAGIQPTVPFITAPTALSARVHLLNRQGESPSAIAAILNLSVATVNGYLGIANPGAAANAIPTQTPGLGQGAAQGALSVFA